MGNLCSSGSHDSRNAPVRNGEHLMNDNGGGTFEQRLMMASGGSHRQVAGSGRFLAEALVGMGTGDTVPAMSEHELNSKRTIFWDTRVEGKVITPFLLKSL